MGPLYGVRLMVLTELDPVTGLPAGNGFTIKDALAYSTNKGTGSAASSGSFTGDAPCVYELIIVKENSEQGTITDAEFIWRLVGGEWSVATAITGTEQTLSNGIKVMFIEGYEGQDFEVGDTWTIAVTGKEIRVATPQQVGFSPQITEGTKHEHRGGDRLIVTIEELDKLTGMNATFQDAILNYEAMALIGGGKTTATGYEALTLAEQAEPRTPFMAEVYIAKYAEGSQVESSIIGYTKVTLWNCTGNIPTFTAQDQNFLVPSYTIKSRDNMGQAKPCFSIDDVDSLPAA